MNRNKEQKEKPRSKKRGFRKSSREQRNIKKGERKKVEKEKAASRLKDHTTRGKIVKGTRSIDSLTEAHGCVLIHTFFNNYSQ